MKKYFKDRPYLIFLIPAILIFFIAVTFFVVNKLDTKHTAQMIEHTDKKTDIFDRQPMDFSEIMELERNYETKHPEPKVTYTQEVLSKSLDTFRTRKMKYYKRPLNDSTLDFFTDDSLKTLNSIKLSQTQVLHVLKLTKDSLKKELAISKVELSIDTIINSNNECKELLKGKNTKPENWISLTIKENTNIVTILLSGICFLLIVNIVSNIVISRGKRRRNRGKHKIINDLSENLNELLKDDKVSDEFRNGVLYIVEKLNDLLHNNLQNAN